MLMVSDLVGLARGAESVVDLAARSPARFASKRPPRAAVVVWNVCRHCNMTCPHCYSSASLRRSPRDLPTTEVLRILGELAAAGVGNVVWSGGEPLLREDLTEFVARTRELGMTPHLSTNGVLLAEQARALAGAGLAYAGVSLDAPGQKNDAYRGLVGGFDLAARGLAAARVAGIKTGIRMTVTRRNARDLGAMLDLAGRLDVDRFYVSHLVYAGRALGIAGDDLSPAESRSLLLALFDHVADAEGPRPRVVTGGNDSGGPLFVRWVGGRFGAAAAERVKGALLRRGGNSAGEAILAIDHRGRVHPDQFWQSAVLGDLREQSFTEILRHPLRAELKEREQRLGGRCGSCRFVGLCRGSHRERAIARSQDLWAPDPACVMTDEEVGAVRYPAGAFA
jgi:radical SAM protein with 4Fe4S-binding SPASM domain